MTFDPEKVEELLDGVCLDMMLISADNLVEISGVMGRLAPLNEAFAPLNSPLPGRVIQSLQEALASVIRGQITDHEQVLVLIGEGLCLLQEMTRTLPEGEPVKGDVEGWAKSLADLATAPGFLAQGNDHSSERPPLSLGGGTDSEGSSAAETQYDSLPQEGPVESGSVESGSVDLVCVEEEPVESDSVDFVCEEAFPVESVKSEEVLPLDYFGEGTQDVVGLRRELLGEVEKLQVLVVSAEQKSEPWLAFEDISRSFRNILATVSLLQLEDMALLAFNSEGLMEYVADDQVPYSTIITDFFLQSCDFFMSGFNGLELLDSELSIGSGSYSKADLEQLNEELWMARQGIMPMGSGGADSGSGAQVRPKKIGQILIEKGLISEGDLGELIMAQQEARKATLGDILLAENLVTLQDLELALKEQKASPDRRLGEILVALGILDYEQIEQAVHSQEEKRGIKLGEFLVKSKIGAPEKVAIALREQKQSVGGRVGSEPMATHMVKVETMKLDGLIDLVGELVIAQSLVISSEAITSMKEHKIAKDMAHVSHITSELQRNAMRLRMVQISQTFQKMNRIVRDLGNRFDKDVRFETHGGDTDVDRNMVESINDPLVHLLRNAMDHGLETPAERKAAGKSPQGTLTLRAFHQGGNVVIELIDDGRGVDQARVLEKAVSQGLVAPGEVLNEAAIHNLIFQPGFSTAEAISDISGRGVGLDVVRKAIEKLRGKVEFTSVLGRGSTMTIRLPLTLAIIDGMIIRVGEHRYILPTISIAESFRPIPQDYFTVKNQGEMIRVRKELLPLIRLDSIVGASGAVTNPEEALVVVVENGKEKRCLLVDEVLGKQEVVIKPLGDWLKSIRSLAGATILGDGCVGLILDVPGLLEVANGCGGGSLSSGSGGNLDEDWQMGDESWD